MSLAAMSYYSSPNSQLFKVINITWNEDCFALNQNAYFEMSPEDQIAVSFICNDQFQIYRVCMRPHAILDFSKYADNATEMNEYGIREHRVLTFNKFYLEVKAV